MLNASRKRGEAKNHGSRPLVRNAEEPTSRTIEPAAQPYDNFSSRRYIGSSFSKAPFSAGHNRPPLNYLDVHKWKISVASTGRMPACDRRYVSARIQIEGRFRKGAVGPSRFDGLILLFCLANSSSRNEIGTARSAGKGSA